LQNCYKNPRAETQKRRYDSTSFSSHSSLGYFPRACYLESRCSYLSYFSLRSSLFRESMRSSNGWRIGSGKARRKQN
ncbi:hypothetical protein FRC16_007797, partial [Serendipita sp. 398]